MGRTIRPRTYGTPEVLVETEVARLRAGAGEVVVDVRAAGVNPVDWKVYSGSFHAVDPAHQDAAGLAAAMPSLGLECAGVVAEVGADAVGAQVGDEVIMYPVTAAYADQVVVPVSSLIAKPQSLGWAEAGGLMLAGTTAAHALHAAGVGAGDTVLVHGGSGGVGLMAVQLARLAGAEVIATAAEHNHALLRELGATPVVYGPGLADRVRAAAAHPVSAAVDAAGTDEALDVSVELVGDPRRIASITGSARRADAGIKLLGYGPGQDAGAEFRTSVRADLAERAGAGELRVVIAATFPLSEAAQAHVLGQSGHRPGKIILVP